MKMVADWIKELRELMGSKRFEGQDFTVFATVLYDFIFAYAPEEMRSLLFKDFVVNFWTSLVPVTNYKYHKVLSPVTVAEMDKVAKKLQPGLQRKLHEMLHENRYDAERLSQEVYAMIKSASKTEGVFMVYILLISDNIPHRFFDPPIYATEKEVYDFSIAHPQRMADFQNLVRGLFADQSTELIRKLWQRIEATDDRKEQIILLFICAATAVYLVREYGASVLIPEDESAKVQRFEKDNGELTKTLGRSTGRARFADVKFRSFMDQAAFLLERIESVNKEDRYIALFLVLANFSVRAAVGEKDLPYAEPIDTSATAH